MINKIYNILKANFNFSHLFYSLLFSSFFLFGGFEQHNMSFFIYIIIFSLIFIISTFFSKNNIKIPSGFLIYIFFLVTLAIHTIISPRLDVNAKNVFLYLIGGLVWLVFFNLHKPQKTLSLILILVGLLFIGVFFYQKIIGINTNATTFGLDNYAFGTHIYLADLWSVIIIIPIYNLFHRDKRTIYNTILLVIGLTIIAASYSRSALFSLIGVIFYLSENIYISTIPKSIKLLRIIIYLIILFILIVFSMQKSLLNSRPYFRQALIGFTKYPLGVGVGNFYKISQDTSNSFISSADTSFLVHNIVLEFLSGMGIFSITFILWLFYEINTIFKNVAKNNLLARCIFIAITINFMFNSVYAIPTMLWLWFAALGSTQTEQ